MFYYKKTRIFVRLFMNILLSKTLKTMKKSIFTVLAAAIMMVACSQSDKGFVINGTVEGIEDGDSVFLNEGVFNEEGSLMSATVVKDGKFEFKGEAVGTKFVSVTVKHAGEQIARYPFFVEDNILSVTVRPGEEEGSVEGGGENQLLLSAYYDILTNYMSQLDEQSVNLEDSTLDEAKRNEVQQRMDSLAIELDSVAVQFIISKMPSEFSNVVFAPVTQVLPKEMLQILLDAYAEKQPDASYYKKYLEENK